LEARAEFGAIKGDLRPLVIAVASQFVEGHTGEFGESSELGVVQGSAAGEVIGVSAGVGGVIRGVEVNPRHDSCQVLWWELDWAVLSADGFNEAAGMRSPGEGLLRGGRASAYGTDKLLSPQFIIGCVEHQVSIRCKVEDLACFLVEVVAPDTMLVENRLHLGEVIKLANRSAPALEFAGWST
jgi:hypothetical protein